MRGSTKRVVAGLCCAAFVAAACSGDDDSDATAPVPTADGEESVPSTEESAPDDDGSVVTDPEESEPVETDPPDDTEPPETTTATTESAPERRLPEDLGPVTDSIPYPDAPGVDAPGEFYEIYEDHFLYLPFEDSADDPAVRAPSPTDLEILAAYGRAQGALASQTFDDPVEPDPNEAVRSAFLDRGQALSASVFRPYAEQGLRDAFLFDAPNIFRPRIDLAASSDVEAVVLDCEFLSGATIDEEGQPLSSEIQPYFEFGLRAELARAGGEWLMSSFGPDSEACP
ncbi:MAG: hypothetical protein AAGF91_11125 [Actinomycetota bacterium]